MGVTAVEVLEVIEPETARTVLENGVNAASLKKVFGDLVVRGSINQKMQRTWKRLSDQERVQMYMSANPRVGALMAMPGKRTKVHPAAVLQAVILAHQKRG